MNMDRLRIRWLGLAAVLLVLAACGQAPAPPASPISTSSESTPIPPAPTELTPTPIPTESLPFSDARAQMVEFQIENRGVSDPLVLEAMRKVPRHEFVPKEYLDQAYADHPLPIGFGQTISQPYIVALMSEALGVEPGDKVLEIGTGSGYQAAVLAQMGMEVYTVEIIPELAERAQGVLEEMGYRDVAVLSADGYFGWEEHAPYDAVIVTAAPDHLPQPLAAQLKEGARLVIPIGPIGAVQTLWQFEKVNGELEATNLGGVRFVPLTGGE
ncbi:MAG: protein-L-isoaspartate(D-aspartate) O-methyltransferase [Anaerolineales bacterium]|jgi:protein-L-isoaspartate(D-aspartate) O-methyltransferase